MPDLLLDSRAIAIELLHTVDKDGLPDLGRICKKVAFGAPGETCALEAVVRTVFALSVVRVAEHVLDVLGAEIHTLTAFDINEELGGGARGALDIRLSAGSAALIAFL